MTVNDIESRREWVNEYFNLRFSENTSNKSIVKCNNLKREYFAKLGGLYRYRNLEDLDRILGALEMNAEPRIWFSYPSDFNDPFDTWLPNVCAKIPNLLNNTVLEYYNKICDLSPHNKPDKSKYLELCSDCLTCDDMYDFVTKLVDIIYASCPEYGTNKVDIFKRIDDELRQPLFDLYREKQHERGIVCFSEVPNSILMWSHYADKHTGICLGYSKQTIENRIIKGNQSLFEYIHPVNYKSDLSDQVILLSNLILSKFYQKKYNRKDAWNLLMKNSLTKSPEWEYEREWRVSVGYDISEPSESMRYMMLKPDCIYLGAKIDLRNETRIRDVCNIRGICVKKMQMADNRYELIAREY